MPNIEPSKLVDHLRSHFPYRSLATLPTPYERLETLSKGFGAGVWAKRDDLTGELYGGNKVRKLEFLLGDALEQGRKEVWTVGAIGSNHVLATSIYAESMGLSCAALHFPQPFTEHVRRNLLAVSSTPTKLTLVGGMSLPVKLFKSKLKEWLNTNPGVYYIPGGGSSPVGVLGYVAAAAEFAEQLETESKPVPDVVFVAAGTCGTLAGLVLGARLVGLKSRFIGVRVVERVISNPRTTAMLARQTAELMVNSGLQDVPRLGPDDFEFAQDQFGKGYGVPTTEGAKAMETGELDGLYLDPTYTGKALAALLARRAELAGKNLCYWHTLSGADISSRVERGSVEQLPDDYHTLFERDL